VWDFVLYVLVGLGAVAATFWYAGSGGDSDFLGRWVGLVGMSLILFAYAVQRHRRLMGEPWFWVVLLAAAAIHLSAYVFVLRQVSQWQVMWFVIPIPLEEMAIDIAISFVQRNRGLTQRLRRTG